MTTEDLQGWDGYDAYLFDIDGTLMNCTDAVHYFAFCETLSKLAGRPVNLDGVTAHGNTDVGILRDALALAGVPEVSWRPRLPEAREAMCRFVEAREQELRTEILPGVVEVLRHLRKMGKVVGVATGNLEGIGRAKLRKAGLLAMFDFGGYSDAFEYRRDVFAGALMQARGLVGAEARICVVGDTPEDVRAARATGLDVIAVATGIYGVIELREIGPTVCVGSMRMLLEGSA